MSKAARGRRVPPKARSRSAASSRIDEADAYTSSEPEGDEAASEAAATAAARATRAQNRAAKRAASGVRPKAVRGGPVRRRSSRDTSTAVVLLVVAAIAVGAAVIALGNPFGSASASPSPAATELVYGDGTCPTSEPDPLAAGEVKYVSIETEKGTIVIKVDGSLSPIAAGNFVALADCGFYDGVVFHRTPTLASGAPFVIQGGDPDGDGSGGPGYTITDEPVTAEYKRGTVAMARTQAANSQGSQFFIVLSDESGPILKSANTYAIFGTVVSGMDVADAIYQASGGQELPTSPIAMTTVTVSDTPPATAAPTSAPTAAPTTAGSPAPSGAATTAP